jgi:hypothetical protein
MSGTIRAEKGLALTSTATGWKVEVGPFPGWKTVPTW